MAFPRYTPPQLGANPYQIAGQAVTEIGGQVQQFGENRDKLRMAFDQMVEARKQKLRDDERAAEALQLQKDEATRKQSDFEQKQKADESKQAFLKEFTGADPTDPANQARLQQALTAGIIDAATYSALQPKPKKRELQNVTGRGLFEIPEEGAPQLLVDAPPPRVESQLPGQRYDLSARGQTFQQENALRDEFNKKTLPFETALTAFTKMQNAIDQNNSADAYAAVIDFVKTLDPGSTVREGEYTTARGAGAGGKYGQLKQAIRGLYDGKMTPEVRKTLYDAGLGLIKAEKSSYDRVRDDYKRRVGTYRDRGYDLDENAILSDYGTLEDTLQGYEQRNAPPRSSKANDKTFKNFQEAASLPVGTGFWINGRHYTKGPN